jgi:septal ring factor EnvC (AmiA/AmiB activator)
MDGKKLTIVGIVAILIGLLVGYLLWGTQVKDVAAQLAQVKGQLAQAQAAVTQEKALAAKVQALEAQLRQVEEQLRAEKAAREKLQASISHLKK